MKDLREQVIETVKNLPEEQCKTMEDILEAIYIRYKIQRGLDDVEAGRVISQEQMEKEVLEWIQSGQRKQKEI